VAQGQAESKKVNLQGRDEASIKKMKQINRGTRYKGASYFRTREEANCEGREVRKKNEPARAIDGESGEEQGYRVLSRKLFRFPGVIRPVVYVWLLVAALLLRERSQNAGKKKNRKLTSDTVPFNPHARGRPVPPPAASYFFWGASQVEQLTLPSEKRRLARSEFRESLSFGIGCGDSFRG